MVSKKLHIFLALLVIFFYSMTWSFVYSSISLENAFDLAETIQPGVLNVSHSFTFTLPPGPSVSPTDYILIKMPNYPGINISNINAVGSFVYGDNTGIQASLSGTTVTITNLSIVAGSTVSINGITAQNPAQNGPSFDEQIIVSSDSAGINVIHLSNISPEGGQGVVSATASVLPYTAEAVLSGYSFPGVFITVSENSSVIGTTTPDGTGFFTITLTGLNPGIHNFDLYGIDASNNTTATTTISLYTPAYDITNYTNIILSPIIQVSPSQVNQGDTLTISGEAVPNSTITISINSPLTQLSTSTDANGNFSYPFTGTSSLDPGQYQVNATVQTQSSVQSINSLVQNFIILSGSVSGSGPQPNCDISKGDLNCDGQVNLIDFSILLFYWGTNSALADINHDGTVNLVDFSIMLYYFTG